MDTGVYLLTILILTGYNHVTDGAQSYYTVLESQLRTLLFTDYQVLSRPSDVVSVQIAFNLLNINSLDIRTQELTTTGYFTMVWPDPALNWTGQSNYSIINSIFTTENVMWRPAIVIENSVSDLEVFSDEDTLIRVNMEGTASWSPGGVFTTYCEAIVTYYPLDTQECSVILSTWAYTSSELTLQFSDPAFELTNFRTNGEWSILETSTYTETTSRQSNSYSRLYYNIKLQRRSLYHVLNTMFPVILMASLIAFAFKLPLESGERIGMSLTVLLTYAVYLTLISDNIPQTSLHTSVLGVYLTMILILCTLSVIFTIYILNMHFRTEEEPVPPLLQSFARHILSKIASCTESQRICRSEKVAHDDKMTTSVVKLETLESNESKEQAMPVAGKTQGSILETETKFYTWQEIAQMFDICFMRLFTFFVFLCTFISCMILIINYNS